MAELLKQLNTEIAAIFPATTNGSYMGEAMSAGYTSKMPELFVAMLDEFLEDTVREN